MGLPLSIPHTVLSQLLDDSEDIVRYMRKVNECKINRRFDREHR